MDEMLSRAYAAYFRAAVREGYDQPEPSSSSSGEVAVGGKSYVVLRNVDRVLAVYRVRNDGLLKRLRRWPAEVDTPP